MRRSLLLPLSTYPLFPFRERRGTATRCRGKAGVDIAWIRGDATALQRSGARGDFQLIVDNGCLHGLPDEGRDAYVREVTAVAAPDAVMLLAGFSDNPRRRGPRGFDPPEVERRFAGRWTLVGHAEDPAISNDAGDPIRVYELRRLA